MVKQTALAAGRRTLLLRAAWMGELCCVGLLVWSGCAREMASNADGSAAPSEMSSPAGTGAMIPASGGGGAQRSAGSGALLMAAGSSGAAQAGAAARVDAGAAPGSAAAGSVPSTSMDPTAGSSAMSDPADKKVTFHNGGFWQDAAGARIEAHGGGFLRVDDTWYWFGEDKSGNSAGFKGVNCYASKDLVTWESRGAVVTRDTSPELSAMDRIIERPKVSFNASTQRYVMWLHWEGRNYAEAKAGVLSSAKVDGPYAYQDAFQPLGNMSRDDTLFVDEDGTAYFISAANENADLMIYELAPDYLTIKRLVIKLFAGQKREAPALFKDQGTYYLITSAATGWDSNQAKFATAKSMAGPWSELRNLGNGTTYDTQPTYIIPVHGSKQTTYIYAGDRWQDPDLASSKYIWLPLNLTAGQLTLDNYPDWSLNLTTGEWFVDDGFIAQDGWRLLHVDSEETAAEDARATRAFDNSASTFWHTAYTNEKPAPPHELQIDLGATYSLTGMRYLPRQDGSDNGTIADYELYISEDPTTWGPTVAKGSFAANREPKSLTFAPHLGRYLRFVALREIGDRPYTSIAELDLTGTPQ